MFNLEEKKMERYEKPKILWELCIKKERHLNGNGYAFAKLEKVLMEHSDKSPFFKGGFRGNVNTVTTQW